MSPTIYLAGSISGGRGDVPLYRRIAETLTASGFEVLAGAVAAEHVGAGGEALEPCFIFERDITWLSSADLIVAEVSTPSTGVGYEIATARYRYGIPVIGLYRRGTTTRCSAMVAGDGGIALIDYSDETTESMLERLLDTVNRLSGHKLAEGGVTPRCQP
jgi:nucleoside 2-deoxyribosyltransferase